MFDDRHTALPQGTLLETDIHPVPVTRSDIGKARDLRDTPSVPQGSAGRRTRRNWYVMAAAGVILVGAGVWSFGARMMTPGQGIVPPPLPVVTVAFPLRENITNRTELTGQFSAVNQVGLRAQVSGYLSEIHFQYGQVARTARLNREQFATDELLDQRAQTQRAAAAAVQAAEAAIRSAQLNLEFTRIVAPFG